MNARQFPFNVRWIRLLGLLCGALWLAACASTTRSPVLDQVSGGDPARGRRVLQEYGCEACHTIPGVPGATADVGPTLEEFAYRTYIAGSLPNTPENLIAWIMAPQAIRPDTAMPDMGVTEADARDIAAFLATVRGERWSAPFDTLR